MKYHEPDLLQANSNCLTAMLLWAMGFVAVEYLFDHWGVLSLLSLRLVVSIIFLVLWWGLTESWTELSRASWSQGLRLGGFGWGVGAILLLIGQRLSDPVATGITVAMMPIAGATVEVIFDNRQVSSRLCVGIIFAVVGGYLATGVNLAEGNFGLGVFLCLSAMFLFAWATRATTLIGDLSPIGQSTVTLCGGMLVSLLCYVLSLMAGLEESRISTFEVEQWLPLAIYVLPSCGIAQLLWIRGAGRLGVLLASFHMNAVPFYVMVIMVLLSLAEWKWIQAGGVALVAFGVLVSQMGSPHTSDAI